MQRAGNFAEYARFDLNFFEKKGIVEVRGARGRNAVLQGAREAWHHPDPLVWLQLGVNVLLIELPDPRGLELPVTDVPAMTVNRHYKTCKHLRRTRRLIQSRELMEW